MTTKQEIEVAFKAFSNDKWDKLSEDQRDKVLSKWEEILTDPQKALEYHYLDLRLEEFKIKYWSIKLLIIGLGLGITGNLFANLLDRYFVRFGSTYAVFIILTLFLSIWLIIYFVFKTAGATINSPLAKELKGVMEILSEFF
jgi:hypothetical protein